MSVEIAFSDLRSSIPREGYAYWLGKKGDRPFPARADFDPMVEVPKLSRQIILLDVQREPLDFRYRFVGTQLRQNMAMEWTGQWMSKIDFQRPPNPIWGHHQWVVENQQPRFIRPTYIGPNKEFKFVEAAILPLGPDGKIIDMLMIFVDFVSKVKR
jgi:hypothetical protein